MISEIEKLKKHAIRRMKMRNDPRYIHTIRALEGQGLLVGVNFGKVRGGKRKLSFEEIYFAGHLEPRVFEVLPAIILRKPSMLLNPTNPPEDLKVLLKTIRSGGDLQEFHGIAPKNYLFWVDHLKRENSKDRMVRKNFRLSKEDTDRLEFLRQYFKLHSHSEVLRKALESLSSQTEGS